MKASASPALPHHSSIRWFIRLLALVVLTSAPGASLRAAMLLKQNFETTNPWGGMATFHTSGGGSVSVAANYSAVGTIDTYLGGAASSGVQLTVNSSAATGAWRAGLSSGVLALADTSAATAARGLAFRTLAFSMSASSAYPVRVKIESFNASSVRTGGLATLIFPAGPDFYLRYAIDLDKMTPDGAGAFVPGDPNVQVTFELDSTANGTGWPAAAGHALSIDNISYATPKYYVGPAGNNNNDGLTEAMALATVQKAADKLVDNGTDNIVAIMAGTVYSGTSTNGETVKVTKTGTPDAWFVFKNYPGDAPVVSSIGWHVFKLTNNKDGGVNHYASYVEIRGLTIRGQSYVDANGDRQINATYQADVGQNVGSSNGNGISVDGRPNTAVRPHHFRFADNTVELCAGGGINALDADRVQVENNLVRNNCWWSLSANSGINFFETLDTETGANYRMLMQGNVVYGNESMVPWFGSNGQFSDGNGIILDTYNLAYTGKTLLSNNLAYNNGGGGVHVLQASNVDVVHNTAYFNSASPNQAYPQIDTQGACNNVRTTNNIMVAPRNPAGVNSFFFSEPATAVSTFQSSNIVHTRNVYAGGDSIPPLSGASLSDNKDLGRTYNASGLFVSPSIDPAVADFRLRPSAWAINYGSAIPYRSVLDLAGTARTLTGTTDGGGYQTVSARACSPLFSVALGNYFGSAQNVTLSSDTAGSSIVYTNDGSLPTVDESSGTATRGTLYPGNSPAISISSNTTLKAISWKAGLSTSPVSTAIYDFTDRSALPASLSLYQKTTSGEGIPVMGGIVTGSRSVQGLSRTPGAFVRYTTDGVADPTLSTGTPQEYRGYTVLDSATLRYRAFKTGRADSAVASVNITVRASAGSLADGTSLVTIGSNVMRFVRFQASDTFSAFYIFARVNGVPGSYRAAIYSDTSGAPSTRRAVSSSVSSPATGWTAFPLAARYSLTAGSYYWLALWSDDASGGVYASATGGTVREAAGTLPSGAWPDPAGSSTVVAGTDLYAIYATNQPPNLAPVVSAGADQVITAASSANLSGNVTDDGVPLAPGAVTSSWSVVNGPGSVTFANSASPVTSATFSLPGTYLLRLTSRDSLLTASDDVSIILTPTPLQTWRQLYFTPAELANPSLEVARWGHLADANGDGISNLVAYALGVSPLLSPGAAMPAGGAAASGALTLSFLRASADLTYTVEGSSGLQTWDPIATNPGIVGERVTVPDTGDRSDGRRFLRLRISLP